MSPFPRFLVCTLAIASAAHSADYPFRIPPETTGKPFQVTAFSDEAGKSPATNNLSLKVAANWSAEGLILRLHSTDNDPVAPAPEKQVFEADSWEVFLSSPPTYFDRWQIAIATGTNGETGTPPSKSIRPGAKPASDFKVSRVAGQEGQTIELKIPWASLDAHGKAGQQLNLQVQFNDFAPAGNHQTYRWFPSKDSWIDPSKAYVLQLDRTASPSCDTFARVSEEHLRRIFVDVSAPPASANHVATILRGDTPLATGTLALRDGAARGKFTLPFPEYNERNQPLLIRTDNGSCGATPLLAVDAVVKDKLKRSLIRYLPFVFNGEKFPVAEPEMPTEFDTLVGPYRIETTYYDSARRPVTSATAVGRYGAISRVIMESGREFVRYNTIFRQPNGTPFWAWKLGGKLDFREPLAISGTALEQESEAVDSFVRQRVIDGFITDPDWPVLLAGLTERDPSEGKATLWNDVYAHDRAWWLPLKLELYKMTAKPFEGPKRVAEKSAPEIREGTVDQAGIDPMAVAAIDSSLTEWVNQSEEAFTACIARNGVVFFHKAYGTRDGIPATVNDVCFMASTTKLMGATAVMMLVEDGRLDLDADIAKYLPPFRDIKVARPATLRHLLTHTAGMTGHHGDKLSDFPERIAENYDSLAIGRRFQYNGDSYELAGKIIELSTGEIIPQFQKKHLLDPLGMTHTQVGNMSGNTFSTAMDMVHFGQMFLNGGAYGPYRFLKESTIESMRPRKLVDLLGPSTETVWGLGMMPFDKEPLGAGVMGHGAASGTILRVDPKRRLVVSLVRNAPGKDFEKHKDDFLRAIANIIPAKKP